MGLPMSEASTTSLTSSVDNHSLSRIFPLDVTIITRSSLCNIKLHEEMSMRTAEEQFHSLTKAPQKLTKAGYEV